MFVYCFAVGSRDMVVVVLFSRGRNVGNRSEFMVGRV